MKILHLIFLIIVSLTTCKKQKSNNFNPEISIKSKIYQIGYATWYGPGFHGNITANGEIYDMYQYSAAHRKLPLGSIVKVYNPTNNKFVIVKINDRGPVKKTLIIDLSKLATETVQKNKLCL